MRDELEAHVGRADDFPIDAIRIVRIGKREIGIIRGRDGEFHAVLNVCPHRGAPVCQGTIGGTMLPSAPGELRYGREGKILKCPWHGYEFDIETGASSFGIIRGRLRKFPTELREGEVYVKLN